MKNAKIILPASGISENQVSTLVALTPPAVEAWRNRRTEVVRGVTYARIQDPFGHDDLVDTTGKFYCAYCVLPKLTARSPGVECTNPNCHI